MEKTMTITERINSIDFDSMTSEDFEFLKERALKSVRKANPNAPKKESKAHKENAKFAGQVDELAGDKGYVTINEVQLALGLQTPQKAQAIVKAAGYVKTDENVDGKAVWKK